MIKEESALINIKEPKKISKKLPVFYNPVMKFNRDISVTLLNAWPNKNLQIADVLAGSGIRAIRFLKELNKSKIKNITVNDYNKNFKKNFEKFLKLNKIKKSKNTKNITLLSQDANKLLLESTGFDYIDVDPFGTPNPFLDLAARRISRNGILAVTATDTASLAGTFTEVCQRKYFAKPLHNYLMHEIGLRILIRKIQLIGGQYEKSLVPIFSYFKDHYFRIFFACTKGKTDVDKIIEQHKYFLFCSKCLNYKVSEYNNEICCSSKMAYAGPLWTGNLFDEKLVETMIKKNKIKDIGKFLEIAKEESKIKNTGFYDVHELCKHYKLGIPKKQLIIEELKQIGQASETHFNPEAIKTNLSSEKIIKAIKELL
jgi:tRNA (guanine26-N2/guanine27-N2)-dimethyltransferase